MLWNPVYETGIPIVDAQHKELFRQVDMLLDKTNKVHVPKSLEFLGNYVVKHFGTEENLQRQCNYPKFQVHQTMHKKFVQSYLDLKKKYETSGENPILLMQITSTALNWLKSHIRVEDKAFAEFYKANLKPIGPARARAF